jgi:hypothetical protein
MEEDESTPGIAKQEKKCVGILKWFTDFASIHLLWLCIPVVNDVKPKQNFTSSDQGLAAV